MPTVKLAPIARAQFLDTNGDPLVGGLLYTYAAGSSTKLATYTDNTGTTANTNPIVLDAAGRTPYGLWYESGLVYKQVLALATDTDPPTSPIYTADVLVGVNDTTTAAALAASSQWVASGLTPTYVSATQFTLVGDQTAAFHVGRRLRFTVTAGTVYGRISVTAFGALTTVTVVLDSGALDAGLSAVDVGILTALNNSLPEPSSVGFQPLDGLLTALAAQTTAAAKVQGYTGADAVTLYDFKDEDNMASDSATSIPSQQSVKAYVTAQVATSVADSDFTGTNQSLATSGYQKLPGGLIIQWGETASLAPATPTLITYPIAFPTAVLTGHVEATTGPSAPSGNTYFTPTSLTQFTTSCPDSAAHAYRWLAIGY